MVDLLGVEEIRRLLEAATPGPWEAESSHDYLDGVTTWRISGLERWRGLTNAVTFGEDEGTARLVAAAPALAAEALKLHEENGRLRDALHHVVIETGGYTFGTPSYHPIFDDLHEVASAALGGDQ